MRCAQTHNAPPGLREMARSERERACVGGFVLFFWERGGRVGGRWRLQRRAAQQVAEADVLIEDLTVAGHGFGVFL